MHKSTTVKIIITIVFKQISLKLKCLKGQIKIRVRYFELTIRSILSAIKFV